MISSSIRHRHRSYRSPQRRRKSNASIKAAWTAGAATHRQAVTSTTLRVSVSSREFSATTRHCYISSIPRFLKQGPRLTPTAELERDWVRVRREIRLRARGACPLLPRPPPPDPVFVPPPGVTRPRVSLSLGFRNGARLGELPLELFTDVCPRTCELFVELLRGDGLGHCYVGTCFYRKVPGLYWSGGDVTRDCGLGCYAPRGRRTPPPAENYHYPHSAPGLLTMHVTRDDEVCGTFSITFKPLPQFDLRSVVFGGASVAHVREYARTRRAAQHEACHRDLCCQVLIIISLVSYVNCY
ncbi:peptidyl-prolyl cis-trans isomerase D-like isoform X3 [Choristoneura fumiferana]|uniref:peptidyl-prolyl cis-trans isomerase D-like isoform X3 n=1 Tax=Choristoneura fumiferana TaxID=7141 RepID=UPI003D157C63